MPNKGSMIDWLCLPRANCSYIHIGNKGEDNRPIVSQYKRVNQIGRQMECYINLTPTGTAVYRDTPAFTNVVPGRSVIPPQILCPYQTTPL